MVETSLSFRAILLALALSAAVWLVGCKPKGELPLEEMKSPQLVKILDSLRLVEVAEAKRHDNIPRLATVTVRPGNGLYQVMQQAGLDNQATIKIINALKDSVELTKLKVGDSFQVGIDRKDPHKVVSFRFAQTPALIHLLDADSSGALQYRQIELPTTIRYHVYNGVLEKGSTLDATLRKIGIPKRMTQIVTGVLQCKVSFATSAHPGDKFKVLVEERMFQDSIWIEGKVLYANFEGKNAGFHEAFRYDDGDVKSSFNAHYTPLGEALVFSGLRYPLDRLHISSGYGMRLHPVLGRREMHWGVDYTAAPGTPVYAVAEGTVVESSFDELSGNHIGIRHKDGTSSWYLHLSVRGVNKGGHVASRQVIGRSGNTGRSTGPHLHFGFKQANGAWMNPLSKRMIATPKLEGERLKKLQKQITEIRAKLKSLETKPSR